MFDSQIDFNEFWKIKIGNIDESELFTIEVKNHLKNLAALLYVYELMTLEVDKQTLTIAEEGIEKVSEEDLVMRRISQVSLSYQYDLAMSIFELTKSGYGNSITILSRSFLENLINLSYLWLSPVINSGSTLERNAWREYNDAKKNMAYNKYAQAETIRLRKGGEVVINVKNLDKARLEAIENEFKTKYPNFKDKNNNITWCRDFTLRSRAKKVDDTKELHKSLENFYLEDFYFTLYSQASDIVHSSSYVESLYVDEGKVKIGSDYEKLNNPLNATVVLSLAALLVLGKLYNANEENLVKQIHHLGYKID